MAIFEQDDYSATARCVNCGKPMKKNLLLKNKNAKFCYTCWMVRVRGKFQKLKWYSVEGSKDKISSTVYLKKVIEANKKQYKYYKR